MNTQTFSRQLQTQGISSQDASYQLSEFSAQEPSQYAQYGEYPDFKDFSQVKNTEVLLDTLKLAWDAQKAVPIAPGHSPGRRLDRRLQPGHCCGVMFSRAKWCNVVFLHLSKLTNSRRPRQTRPWTVAMPQASVALLTASVR